MCHLCEALVYSLSDNRDNTDDHNEAESNASKEQPELSICHICFSAIAQKRHEDTTHLGECLTWMHDTLDLLREVAPFLLAGRIFFLCHSEMSFRLSEFPLP